MGAAAVIAPVVLAAASTAVQVYQTRQAGRQAQRVARHNSEVAAQQAADARRRGQYEEYRTRARWSALLGRQRAAIGSSGADVGSGTPALIVEEQAAMAELDALMARNNAERESWGYDSLQAGFAVDRWAGRQQMTIGAGAQAIGGAAQAVGLYGQLRGS